MSMIGHVVNVTIALIAFRHNVEWEKLLLWAAASYGVATWVLLRWATRSKRQPKSGASSLSSAPRKATIYGAVLAAPWGILGLWLLGNLPQQPELILIALCLGMSASGSMLLSASYSSAITYMLCILAPVVLKCLFILDNGEYRLLGALTVSYSLFLLVCIASCARLFAERSRAVDELRQSLLVTENAKAEIESANARFAAALRNMPQGLSMFDGNDYLVAFNRQYLDIYGLSPDKISPGMKFYEVFADQNLVHDLDDYLRDFNRRSVTQDSTNNKFTFPKAIVHYSPTALSAFCFFSS